MWYRNWVGRPVLTLAISYLRKSYKVLKPGPGVDIDKQTTLKWQTDSELIYTENGT